MRLLLGILFLCIFIPLYSQEISEDLVFNILNTGITENITDGQLFSEEEALFLNSKNELFRLSNGAASKYSTPEHLRILKFVFSSPDNGILVGAIPNRFKKQTVLMEPSTNKNPGDFNLYFQPVYTGHHIYPNNDSTFSVIAHTIDGGIKWNLFELKTNFQISDCQLVDDYYLISTKLDMDHSDGDLWKFEPAKSNLISCYNIGRGINGIIPLKDEILVFGTKRIAFKGTISLNPLRLFWSKKRKEKSRLEKQQKARDLMQEEIIYFNDKKDLHHEVDVPGPNEVIALSNFENNHIIAVDRQSTIYEIQDTTIEKQYSTFTGIENLIMIDEVKGLILKKGQLYSFNKLKETILPLSQKELIDKSIIQIKRRGKVIELYGNGGLMGFISVE